MERHSLKHNYFFYFIFMSVFFFYACTTVTSRCHLQCDDNLINEAIAITNEIIIISDNQEHEIFGTAQQINSKLADKIVDVASRPVQQELFSKQLFRKVIQKENKPIIHLGDFLDISCRLEFENFISIMKESPVPWALTIGNHDGFFVGNYSDGKYFTNWAGLCDGGRYYQNQHHRQRSECLYGSNKNNMAINIFNKATVIKKYIEALSEKQVPELKGYIEKDDHQDLKMTKEKNVNWRSENPSDFFYKLYGEISECYPQWDIGSCKFYNSFLLQEIRLPSSNDNSPEVHVIILDTTHYSKPFSLNTSIWKAKQAGTYGEIQTSQKKKVEEWLVENANKKIITILAGHHPFDDMSKKTREMFRVFINIPSAAGLYFSGHTHKGGWYKHDLDQNNILYELNVGSMSDWPTQYRTLQLYSNPANNNIIAESFYKKVSLNNVDELCGFKCNKGWFPSSKKQHSIINQETTVTFDYYKSLKQKILACLLTYRDMLEEFPNGDVGNVKYAKNADFDNEPEFVLKNFSDYDKLFQFIEKAIANLTKEIDESSEETTREYARLAEALSRYKSKKEMENEFYTYQVCQALWASEEDAKLPSKTGTSRYEKLSESDKNREQACIELPLKYHK